MVKKIFKIVFTFICNNYSYLPFLPNKRKGDILIFFTTFEVVNINGVILYGEKQIFFTLI